MRRPRRDPGAERSVATPDPLELLLRGGWVDPDRGTPVTVPLRSVAIERSLAGREADLVAALGFGHRLAVISDATTRTVLGERVERALAPLGVVVPVVLDGTPHADLPTAEAIRRACAGADALIAVGSGTVNDLCKHAAAHDGKPYAVFATAPSMNGYASMNAAITVDGHKLSLPATPPLGVFMDLAVLAAAPPRMIRAGLGDSLCRSTAQADWLLSHLLLGTEYRRAPFALLAADERVLLDTPEALLDGDLDAMRALARTLVLSGLGMTLCGGSHPASQGEHLISHYIDMFAPQGRAAYFHGEQVAVATLTMARIQEAMLDAGPPRLAPPSIGEPELKRLFGPQIGASCWREFDAKIALRRAAPDFERRVAEDWSDLRERVREVTIPAARIAAVLERAGCPATPAQIDVDAEFYDAAVRRARFLRSRYTFLDLAADAGRLDDPTAR